MNEYNITSEEAHNVARVALIAKAGKALPVLGYVAIRGTVARATNLDLVAECDCDIPDCIIPPSLIPHIKTADRVSIDDGRMIAVIDKMGARYEASPVDTMGLDAFPDVMPLRGELGRDLLARVRFAPGACKSLVPYLSKEHSRKVLMGFGVEHNYKGEPVLVATDGRALAVHRLRDFAYNIAPEDKRVMTIPGELASMAKRFEFASASWSTSYCWVDCDGVTLIAKLGSWVNYPNYRQVIPPGGKREQATLPLAVLKKAIKGLDRKEVRIRLEGDKMGGMNAVPFIPEQRDMGRIPLQGAKAPEGFFTGFMIEQLDRLAALMTYRKESKQGLVVVEWEDETSPLIFEDGTVFVVQMPIKPTF